MTLPTIPGSFRPGGATQPSQIYSFDRASRLAQLQFLDAEERATASLMGFFEDARLELEDFIRRGDLSVSDATFYRQLLDETQRIGSKLNRQGAEWVSSTIDPAYSAGWRTWSSTVVPQAALEALSRDTLGLIRSTTDGVRLTIRQEIAKGILEGLSGSALRQRIIASGLTNIPHWPTVEYRAGVIARTETMKAYNAGALNAIESNGARYAEWIASPDEATCPVCAPRDGVIFRLAAAEDPSLPDPYPTALFLPRIPAHPRCRCTIAAKYRDPSGSVIGGAPAIPPKLPPDAMGGKSPAKLPPAAGDINRPSTLKTLGTRKTSQGYDAHRQFWRSASLKGLDFSKLTKAQYVGLFEKRYGVGMLFHATGKFEMLPKGQLAGLVRAFETFADRGFPIRDLDVLKFIRWRGALPGVPNPAHYIPAGYARSDMNEIIEIAWLRYRGFENDSYRVGNRGFFESSMIHELGHVVDAYRGTQFRSGYGSGAGMADEFLAVHKATVEGLSLQAEIKRQLSDAKRYKAEIEQTVKNLTAADPDATRVQTITTLRQAIEGYDRQIAGLTDMLGKTNTYPNDVPLTDYSRKNEFEDFADSVVAFLLDPALMKAQSPTRYDLVKQYLGVTD